MMLIPISSSAYNKEIISKNIHSFLSDPPDWASDYFYGVFGLTDNNGRPQNHIGFIAGYCQDNFKGRFDGSTHPYLKQDACVFRTSKATR